MIAVVPLSIAEVSGGQLKERLSSVMCGHTEEDWAIDLGVF